MTLQSLLQKKGDSSSHKDEELAQLREKTTQLLAKNKAAAQAVLLGALSHLQSSTPTSKEVEKQIWI
jgi:hypothetical protein